MIKKVSRNEMRKIRHTRIRENLSVLVKDLDYVYLDLMLILKLKSSMMLKVLL